MGSTKHEVRLREHYGNTVAHLARLDAAWKKAAGLVAPEARIETDAYPNLAGTPRRRNRTPPTDEQVDTVRPRHLASILCTRQPPTSECPLEGFVGDAVQTDSRYDCLNAFGGSKLDPPNGWAGTHTSYEAASGRIAVRFRPERW
jgi:hypothetical protein